MPASGAMTCCSRCSTGPSATIGSAWQLLAKGQRFPVAYLETAELMSRLQLNPDQLTWRMPGAAAAQPQVQATVAPAPEIGGAGFTAAIGDAKRRLAQSLGIGAEKIEIIIRL